MREIGSEFEYYELKDEGQNGLKFADVEDYGYCFSGRTAIETVLNDMDNISKACLPSYCCDSMIEPFRVKGIEICFYGVDYKNGLEIDFCIPDDCQVILYCNYFGFETPYFTDAFIDTFHKKGGVIIEDITHSLISNKQKHCRSDYYVASIRKWFPISCGGLYMKRKGRFRVHPFTSPDQVFLDTKMMAMQLKRQYIDAENVGDKDRFLKLYAETNAWLAHNYAGRTMDSQSLYFVNHIKCDEIAEQRRRNALLLYEGLEKVTGIVPLFPVELMEIPLFVPVIIDTNRRDEIRGTLIKESVYCPVHWPKPNAGCCSNLYDRELSIVCDQRYNDQDMKRIINILCNKA